MIPALLISALTLVPLAWKWQLDKRIVWPAALLIALFSWAVVALIGSGRNLELHWIILLHISIIGAISLSLLLWRFYRDPEREPPQDEKAILAPADGRVIYVKKIEEGQVPFSEKKGNRFPLTDLTQSDGVDGPGHLVGIEMTYLDVHVNRAPISGKVTMVKPIKGKFISLKKEEAVFLNERAFSIIENDDLRVGLVQIASRMVRRIVSYVKQGESVVKGQRIGTIRFGSQVDVVLPDLPLLEVKARPGDRVKAGLTIIARSPAK